MASNTAANSFYGTGRRKTSSARVYLRQGTGKVSINGRTLDEFFGRETGRMIVQQPFGAVQLDGKFDVDAHVQGGGSHMDIRISPSTYLCKSTGHGRPVVAELKFFVGRTTV